MADHNIYNDISERTNGDIYIGVVGPVRTGKSTFIKKFMDLVVIPNMGEDYQRERAIDEMPQSAAGRTIMTTEPKFIPEQSVTISVDESAVFNVRLIDCVGYVVPSALGYVEGDQPRMVMTPWYDEPIPFNMAAELGTKKVITEHSTIGLVITTDGSISDIPRDDYEEAEERVIDELRGIGKPFIVLLNCLYPSAPESQSLARSMQEKYGVPVTPVNCMELEEGDIRDILVKILFEFPVREIRVEMPHWLGQLEQNHWLRGAVYTAIRQAACGIRKIREMSGIHEQLRGCEYIQGSQTTFVDLGTGKARVSLLLGQDLFYRVLGEKTGLTIQDEAGLLQCMLDFVEDERAVRQAQGSLRGSGRNRLWHCDARAGRTDAGGTGNHPAGRQVRHPAESGGAVDPHDENQNHHRDYPHGGLGTAVGGTGFVSAQGVCGEPLQNLGVEHLWQIAARSGQRGAA